MASSAPAPRRGGNHSGQLQVMAARCASRIHGWFHGWDVYDRAVQHFFAHPSPNPPIFIEAGAYLGMSACFMSHLLSSKPHPARFVVLDTWGSLEHKRSSWLPEQDVRMIHALGKGDMMLAWAHNVRDMGSWNHISAVRRLSTLVRRHSICSQMSPSASSTWTRHTATILLLSCKPGGLESPWGAGYVVTTGRECSPGRLNLLLNGSSP